MFACKPAAICKGPVTSQTNWRPEWQPDKSTKVCSTCSKGFNVLQRRHHCRHCGRVICGSCGKKKHRVALLKYGYQEPVRVCVSCHETCTQSEELMTAISANGYVAVESLLDAGIKFLAVCWNAAVLGKVVLERALTGTPLNCAGADPNFSTIVFTPFMHAASKGHTKVMQLLRERGADIKYTVPRLDSNLSIECDSCKRSFSADFNSLHTYKCPHCAHAVFEFSEAHACVGMSAIHAAAAKGQTKAVQWLLQNGLSIDARTMVGDTPLMLAVMGGHRETVEHVLEHGADVNLVNSDKESALHKAVAEGAVRIVSMLVASGASVACRNRDGLTPVQLADEKGSTQVIDILAARAGVAMGGSTVAPEGSFGYVKWQTKKAEGGAGGGGAGGPPEGAGKPELEDSSDREAGSKNMGLHGPPSDGLGEWGKNGGEKVSGVGLSGVPREKAEPFKWDDTIPKLADRKAYNALVN